MDISAANLHYWTNMFRQKDNFLTIFRAVKVYGGQLPFFPSPSLPLVTTPLLVIQLCCIYTVTGKKSVFSTYLWQTNIVF